MKKKGTAQRKGESGLLPIRLGCRFFKRQGSKHSLLSFALEGHNLLFLFAQTVDAHVHDVTLFEEHG